MDREKFHGRVRGTAQGCAHPDCDEHGEFRAPGFQAPGSDGPGRYRWFCLEHIRAFNARYNYFAGMNREEIEEAQMPLAGWGQESTTFRATAGVDVPPRWGDFHDPLDAISARFRGRMPKERTDGHRWTPEDRRALKILKLDEDADRRQLRVRYSELVRLYHPDRNGGDRSFEKKLQAVVEAYQLLRASPVFAA